MLSGERLEKLIVELKSRAIDALFIGPSTDMEYIAAMKTHNDERPKGIMISSSGKCFALVPLLYEEEMRNTLGDGVIYKVWADHEGFRRAFKSGCGELGLIGARISINDGVSAVDLIDMMATVKAEYVNGANALSPIRGVKDEAEKSYLRMAGEIADAVMEDISKFIAPGMTEKTIKEKLLRLFIQKGAEDLSFSPIVASGPGGSMPHYNRDDRTLVDGDFVIIDMGCKYAGYCSDMTRTFSIGEPDDERRGVYGIVLEAQMAGEAAVRAGATGQDVDRAARRVIQEAGYGKYFINRLGHGVGMAIHEEPYIIEGNEKPLLPGNVFSIEPGIYLPGKFGVRIENLVVVKHDGTAEALNKFTRDLTVVKG